MIQTMGILCRTYHRDAERLRYTLMSIEKFCRGFSEVVVATPQTSMKAIAPVVAQFPTVKLIECPETPNDYIGQQITKLQAFKYISADIVLHIDSDCIFCREVTPETYLENGLPILFHTAYAEIYPSCAFQIPWQSVTSFFLRRQVDFEFMRLFPLIYPRALYVDFNDHFERLFGVDMYDERSGVEALSYNFHFSEFNVLGAFSYYSERPYHVHVNTSGQPHELYTNRTVRQFCLPPIHATREIGEVDLTEINRILEL